ncbi:MAG: class I SAM-dependent methyltransferase [Clostridia bacterium]|nr:class I SAM-dependent methyltransferase [Clostridia bacterium]
MDKKPKLSIGMAVYDDYNGVYFSIQSLKMFHSICNTDQIEFIVIDNNPNSEHGKETKKFVENWVKGKYIPYTSKKSTSIRNQIFENATGTYTLCIDSHVMIGAGGIDALLDYYDQNPDTNNLLSGPLLYDNLTDVSTQFDPVWRSSMFGIWGINKEGIKNGVPFDIPMHGLGLFSCRTDKWLGFNNNFRGFGGEEGYIHEKFRQAGGKCLCIPQLKWLHRFGRPDGVKYPLSLDDRIFNYFVGWLEIYKDPEHEMILSIKDHFKDKTKNMDILFEEAKQCIFGPSKTYKIISPFKTRKELVNIIPPDSICAELGVAAGDFSYYIITNSKLAMLYSIDMWAGDRGHTDDQYKEAIKKLMPYAHRNNMIRLKFDTALDLFPDHHFDFIYVDGYAHTGQDNGKTLYDWWKKVKPGGVFAGHDYNECFPLMVQSMDEFIKTNNLTLNIINEKPYTSWYIIK